MSLLEISTKGTEYYKFSNGFLMTVRIDNLEWSSVEHYFQASKFIGTSEAGDEYAMIIKSADSPSKVLCLAKQFSTNHESRWILNKNDSRKIGDIIPFYKMKGVSVRQDWEYCQDMIMYRAILAKFTQHLSLRELLLGTGDAVLINNTSRDSYWGNGGITGDGIPTLQGGTMNGQNRMGQILMMVRQELQESLSLVLFRHAIPNYRTAISPIEASICKPDGSLLPGFSSTNLIVSSPYRRAMETATLIASHIGFPIQQILVDWRLSEFERMEVNPFLPPDSLENHLHLSDDERFTFVNERLTSFLNDYKEKRGVIFLVCHGAIVNRLHEMLTGNKVAQRGSYVKYMHPYRIDNVERRW